MGTTELTKIKRIKTSKKDIVFKTAGKDRLSFFMRNEPCHAPVLPLEEWIEISVHILGSELAAEICPAQAIPIHWLHQHATEDYVKEMHHRIEQCRQGRKALRPELRCRISNQKEVQIGHLLFCAVKSKGGFSVRDLGHEMLMPFQAHLWIELACIILHDLATKQLLNGNFYVPWLPTHQDHVWLADQIEPNSYHNDLWTWQLPENVILEPKEVLKKPTSAGNPKAAKLLGLLQAVQKQSEEEGEALSPGVRMLLRPLSASVEAIIEVLAADGIKAADLKTDSSVELEKVKQRLVLVHQEGKARILAELEAKIAEANAAIKAFREQQALLDAGREALSQTAEELNAKRERFERDRAETEELHRFEAEKLDACRKEVEQFQEETLRRLDLREQEVQAQIARLEGLRSETGDELLAKLRRPRPQDSP